MHTYEKILRKHASTKSILQRALLPCCILLMVYGIKHWYSSASTDELQWIFLPLVYLLEQVLPGDFKQQADGTWLNEEWQILLVKSCSGINFFMMSLLAQAAVFTQRSNDTHHAVMRRLLVPIASVLALAWLLTLLANTLRILLAMSCIRHPDLLGWTGLGTESQHRLAGLLVYYPVLVAQMLFMKTRLVTAYWQTAIIAVCMLVLTPLLTGKALADPQLFLRHCFHLFAVITAVGALCYSASFRKPQEN